GLHDGLQPGLQAEPRQPRDAGEADRGPPLVFAAGRRLRGLVALPAPERHAQRRRRSRPGLRTPPHRLVKTGTGYFSDRKVACPHSSVILLSILLSVMQVLHGRGHEHDEDAEPEGGTKKRDALRVLLFVV